MPWGLLPGHGLWAGLPVLQQPQGYGPCFPPPHPHPRPQDCGPFSPDLSVSCFTFLFGPFPGPYLREEQVVRLAVGGQHWAPTKLLFLHPPCGAGPWLEFSSLFPPLSVPRMLPDPLRVPKTPCRAMAGRLAQTTPLPTPS